MLMYTSKGFLECLCKWVNDASENWYFGLSLTLLTLPIISISLFSSSLFVWIPWPSLYVTSFVNELGDLNFQRFPSTLILNNFIALSHSLKLTTHVIHVTWLNRVLGNKPKKKEEKKSITDTTLNDGARNSKQTPITNTKKPSTEIEINRRIATRLYDTRNRLHFDCW